VKKLLGIFAVLFCLLAPALAQNTGTGAYPFASFDNRGFDSVNLGNFNVRFSIPIVSRTGRGLPFNYAIQYDGLVWNPVYSSSTQSPTWVPDSAWGFRGTLNGTVIAGNLTSSSGIRDCPRPPNYSGYVPPANVTFNYIYRDPFGGSHPLDFRSDGGCPLSTTEDGGTTGTGVATDGSGYSLYNGTSQIKTRNGSIITPALSAAGDQSVGLTDSNGNQISSAGNGSYTDTLGATALNIGGGPPTQTLTYPVALQSDGSTTASATISYR